MPDSLLTTTSPPPPELGSIKYPSLMSQHQLKQGYAPSLQSMFANTHISKTPKADLSLLFEHKQQPTPNGPYPSFPHKPEPAPVIPPYPTNMPVPDVRRPPSAYAHQHTSSHSSMRGPSPNGSRAPPYPSPVKDVSHRSTASTSSSSARIVPGSTRDAQVQELRTIKLPRECLSRFLSIARVNTLQNRETCGLLLGKDRGSKYVVTTLLIPKQHSTSDTCMMDEEELVLQFTEERHLITLGWVRRSVWLDLSSDARCTDGCLAHRYIPTLRSHVSFDVPIADLAAGRSSYCTHRLHVLGGSAHPFWFPTDAPRVLRGCLCSLVDATVSRFFCAERPLTNITLPTKVWYLPADRSRRPANDPRVQREGGVPSPSGSAYLYRACLLVMSCHGCSFLTQFVRGP